MKVNIQDAINCVNVDLEETTCENCRLFGLDYSVCAEVDKIKLEALEKQIPKKVIYYDNCGNETPYQSRCPKCYEAINDTWYWAGESWCPYCGQKIQWGD